MSTTIEVATRGVPPRSVVDGGEEQIAWTDLDPTSIDVPCGIWHLWLEGISTRTTEIIVDAVSCGVRMMSGACPLDLELALRIVERLATWSGVHTVESEAFGAIPASDLARYHSADWIRSQVDSFFRVTTASRGSVPVTVPGPFRDVVIGERVCGRLAALDSDEKRTQLLFEIMRLVHHSPGVADKILTITSPGLPTAEPRDLVIWRADRSGLLPKSDLVGFFQNKRNDDPALVTRATFVGLDLPPWEFVDDANIQIESASEAHLATLITDIRVNGLSAFTSQPNPEQSRSPKRRIARWSRQK